MKKILFTVLVSTFMLVGTSLKSEAKGEITIGVVNTQIIIQKSSLYSTVRNAEKEISNLDQSLRKELMEKQSKLQQAMQQKKSKEELEKMYKQYKAELDKKESSARKTLDEKQKNIMKMRDSLKLKVENAIKDIAKQKNITYVVDKQAMFYGGIDITNDVLGKIK